MRFQALGHHGLSLEVGAHRILVDPWLGGSTYWGSWWLYPNMTPKDLPVPTHLVLTGVTPDRLHEATLWELRKRSGADVEVFLPRLNSARIKEQLRSLGFQNLTEMPEGALQEIQPGVGWTWRRGLSCFDLHGTRLVRVSQPDLDPRMVQSHLKEVGTPEFLFIHHHEVEAFPHSFDFQGQPPKRERPDTFALAKAFHAATVIPTGGQIKFLHPEVSSFNRFQITPQSWALSAKKRGLNARALQPGEGWDQERGWSSAPQPTEGTWMEREAGLQVDRVVESEGRVQLKFERFKEYFVRLFERAGWKERRSLRGALAFQIRSDEEKPYWVLDWDHKKVYRAAGYPRNGRLCIQMTEAVLGQAMEDEVVHLVPGALRFRAHVGERGLDMFSTFFGLVEQQEMGSLELSRWLGWKWLDSSRVLGASFEELGQGIVSQWRSLRGQEASEEHTEEPGLTQEPGLGNRD